jgi:DnaJ-class molecular chaperone
VKVPPGVRTGSRIRVAGQGGSGQGGGPPGDLYLVIEVAPDPRFERRGDDLHTTVDAPLETMLLGGEARVVTPDGRTLALRIPATTQDGRTFRLRDQGMPRLGSPDRRGDLHAAIHARLPDRLTARQRALVEQWTSGDKSAVPDGAR